VFVAWQVDYTPKLHPAGYLQFWADTPSQLKLDAYNDLLVPARALHEFHISLPARETNTLRSRTALKRVRARGGRM
jgi:hypothetical protein